MRSSDSPTRASPSTSSCCDASESRSGSGSSRERLTKTKPSQISTCTGHSDVLARSISSRSIIGVVTSVPSSA